MVDKLFEGLCALDGVEALALGGSCAGEHFDQASDYDVYLYCRERCPLLPAHFEENLEWLFQGLYHAPEQVAGMFS